MRLATSISSRSDDDRHRERLKADNDGPRGQFSVLASNVQNNGAMKFFTHSPNSVSTYDWRTALFLLMTAAGLTIAAPAFAGSETEAKVKAGDAASSGQQWQRAVVNLGDQLVAARKSWPEQEKLSADLAKLLRAHGVDRQLNADAESPNMVAEAALLLRYGPVEAAHVWSSWQKSKRMSAGEDSDDQNEASEATSYPPTEGKWQERVVAAVSNNTVDLVKALDVAKPNSRIYSAVQKKFAQVSSEISSNKKMEPLAAPSGDGLVKPGEKYADAGKLSKRLAASGFFSEADAADDMDAFTKRLSGALEKFQADHHLSDDGILGPKTLEALNQTPAHQLDLLKLNLQRARIFGDIADGDTQRQIVVNLPGGRLEARTDENTVMHMRVVFGENNEERRTPLLHDEIETVVFRPYWNVPVGIAAKEIIPDALESRSTFESKRYELVSNFGAEKAEPISASNLRAAEDGELKVRQKPGGNNSLGLVKFLFPNQHAVYLHDTPQDSLFDRSERAFSHGCVRVERPAELATWILQNEGWDKAKVQGAMAENAENNRMIGIETHLPVDIVYFTAWPDEENDGRVAFLPDVYGVDAEEMKTLGIETADTSADRDVKATKIVKR